MKKDQLEIIDFLLKELDNETRNDGVDIDRIEHRYRKQTGIIQDNDLWKKITKICEGEGLIKRVGSSYMHTVTPKGVKILSEFGSYQKYEEEQNELIKKRKEIEELQRKNLILSNKEKKDKWLFALIGAILGYLIQELPEFLKTLFQAV